MYDWTTFQFIYAVSRAVARHRSKDMGCRPKFTYSNDIYYIDDNSIDFLVQKTLLQYHSWLVDVVVLPVAFHFQLFVPRVS